MTALPGLAAVGAPVFTGIQISASINGSNAQLQITEQGQITDRYNAAVTNLGSTSVDVRLGGIYALQRIMQDSPRDQPTVVAVLCAFVRDHASAVTARPSTSPPTSAALGGPPADIQAALTVVGTRNIADDGSATVVDLTDAHLSGADLSGAHLSGADLTGTVFTKANLIGALLSRAHLSDANLSGAFLSRAHLSDANLSGAFLSGAFLVDANLSGAFLSRADLVDADLSGADLSHAFLVGANFTKANLFETNLSGAFGGGFFFDADLTYADFSNANLTYADFSNANLTYADLSNANLTYAVLRGADLSGADLAGVRGLRTGTPRSPTSSTPASSANA